jgi:5-deoxy-D-glucuronate isomerase
MTFSQTEALESMHRKNLTDAEKDGSVCIVAVTGKIKVKEKGSLDHSSPSPFIKF